ncbi:hydroxypyruvate isomerase family protein [Roseobacter ponti]|uniref:TIM barrel protein n=1 Tax=Roseobacter ponti TaxID=1891787 RepID=A0A858SRZ5_9RHOB|nr:TIM barrel protein [Roseobacter ponti]QJF50381.1 TIM barrel protein [Roseobacter ponti]
MTKFSANLGFLWNDLPLPDAIRAAGAAGFDAVECHWPYAFDAAGVAESLGETGLQMLGINTVRGDVAAGENGLSALPGREEEARAAIDQAVAYGAAIDAGAIHVMAGFATGPEAEAVFVKALEYACAAAEPHGITILIEPLNPYDAPGYFLASTGQARSLIRKIGAPNLKLMFDCYHIQLIEGDLSHRLSSLLPLIGHVQFASVPDRGTPDRGEVNYHHIFEHLAALGYDAPLGAEYKSTAPTDSTLGWMKRFAG